MQPTPEAFTADLIAEVTPSVVHPANVVLDDAGDPVLDENGEPVRKENG